MSIPPEGWVVGAAAAAGLVSVASVARKAKTRLELSKAKHPSLRGHSKMSRRVAALVPFYEYDEDTLFRSDDAPAEIASRRREGFMRLAALYHERFAQTARQTAEVEASISDVQFTDT